MLPLYFGPSGMLSKLLQVKISKVKKQFPSAVLLTAKHLVDLDEKDERVAQALVNVINQTIVSRGVERPKVVLVDHGSPSVEVSAVRNHLGCQIRGILGGSVEHVAVASMERRPGEEYAFNEPLLASCLDREPFCRGNVIVTQQFLLPGRHAGLDGDIARICAEACARHPELRVYQTQPIATDPNVIDVLADRFWQAVGTR